MIAYRTVLRLSCPDPVIERAGKLLCADTGTCGAIACSRLGPPSQNEVKTGGEPGWQN